MEYEVFSDKIQIVVAGVKPNYRHLLALLLNSHLSLLAYPCEVWCRVLGTDIGPDGSAAAIQSFVRLLDQL